VNVGGVPVTSEKDFPFYQKYVLVGIIQADITIPNVDHKHLGYMLLMHWLVLPNTANYMLQLPIKNQDPRTCNKYISFYKNFTSIYDLQQWKTVMESQ